MRNKKGEFVKSKTWLVNLILLLSDLSGFAVSFYLITLLRKWILKVDNVYLFDPQVMRTALMLTGISVFMFAAKGLYPGRGRISVMEMKQISEGLIGALAIVSVYIFISSRQDIFSRSIFLLSAVLGMGIISVNRILMRKLITSAFPWWGEPVTIFGTKESIQNITKRLLDCKRLGYQPVIGLSVENKSQPKSKTSLRIIPWSLKEQNRISGEISTVILAIPTSELRQKYPSIYHSVGLKFPKTIFILDNDMYGSMIAQPADLNGQPAMIAKQSLSNSALHFIKSASEISLILLIAIPFFLICLTLTVLIKIESKGPVFYSQARIGKNLKPFRLLKFRTMYVNADAILAQLLQDESVREKWEKYHKLDFDPRITRIGKWIRKFSLDEIPQFFNILLGEMSLIGPRPLVQAEIDQLGELANIIFRVKPGITGWWQVNGRNNLTFEERTQLDIYYIFNWSLWLDAFIFIKTFWVVLFRRGGE